MRLWLGAGGCGCRLFRSLSQLKNRIANGRRHTNLFGPRQILPALLPGGLTLKKLQDFCFAHFGEQQRQLSHARTVSVVSSFGKQRVHLVIEPSTLLGEYQAVRISVVVPAFNEQKLIVDSLRSIKEAAGSFQELGWETELIVCDNNSTDATAELARKEGAIVVFELVNQIGRARNSGAAAATGDWLIFVDADSHPSRALFREVAAQIESGQVLAGGCTVRLDEVVRPWFRFVTGLWNGISRSLRWMAGSFIFCETAAFRKLGGFNLELYASEELELSKRLKLLAKEQGKRIVILHQHPIVTSSRKVHLYSRAEHLRFLGRTILGMGSSLKDPKQCFTWYDGRR
jgi:hypothetical protein